MFETLLGKFLIIGIVTAIVMAPTYWDAVERRFRSITRVRSS